MVRVLQEEGFPSEYLKSQEKCKFLLILEWRHKFHFNEYFRLMTLNLDEHKIGGKDTFPQVSLLLSPSSFRICNANSPA